MAASCADLPFSKPTRRNPAVLEAAGGYPLLDVLPGRRCVALHYPAPRGAGHDVVVAIAAGSRRLGLISHLSHGNEGADGWTACWEAQQDPTIAEIPIIALTAHAMEEDKHRALEAGCSDYATKPVDFPDLLTKISAQFDARH